MNIPSRGDAVERPTFEAVYRYQNEHGLLVFERPKLRFPDGKKIVTYRYGWGPGWVAGPSSGVPVQYTAGKPDDADKYLYRLPEVLAELRKGRAGEVWWTEGESDADALRLYQSVCATSHHQAAGNASSEQAEWFRGFEGWVILCQDMDADTESGGNVGARDVWRRLELLTALGVRTLVVQPWEGKDIRDHLRAGLDLDDLLPVEAEGLAELAEKAARTAGESLRAYLDSPEVRELTEALGEDGRGWRVRVESAQPAWVEEYREGCKQQEALRAFGVRKVSRRRWLLGG